MVSRERAEGQRRQAYHTQAHYPGRQGMQGGIAHQGDSGQSGPSCEMHGQAQ